MSAQPGSSTNQSNLPFSIDNILREDFGPQRTQVKTIPRYSTSGYYVGIPWHYYQYKYWPLAVSRLVPIAGVSIRRQSPINQEIIEQGTSLEHLENKTQIDEEYQSDLEHTSDSDETGKLQSTNDNGKRQHEETTDDPEQPAKKKRPRSQFTEMQIKYLENYFSSNNSYLSRDERTVLAQALDMTELQIRNWFQNKRYQKKHKDTMTASSSKDEESGTQSSTS